MSNIEFKTPDKEIKSYVEERYSQIVVQTRDENAASCCGVGGCSTIDYAVFAEDYTKLNGYVPDADLGLGCGVPTEFAQIKEGDVVVDLGSGAGNDAFVARAIVGERGRVIGIDFTQAMIDKATDNAKKLEFNNVEFRHGDIEDIPMAANRADVVVSNCVLNLVPNKQQAFREMYRILKPGGHFSVSDVVLTGTLPEALRRDAELWAGCVSGAIQLNEYLSLLNHVGFTDVIIQSLRQISLPKEILMQHVSVVEIESMTMNGQGINSVTIYGTKPLNEPCCEPGVCC